MYKKLDGPKKRNFLSRIFNKTICTPLPKNWAFNGVFKLFICRMERKQLAFAYERYSGFAVMNKQENFSYAYWWFYIRIIKKNREFMI